MDERTRHIARLLDKAARELRDQHELVTTLLDDLCSVADALAALADEAEQQDKTLRVVG